MKKLLALIAAVILTLCAACALAIEPADFIGTWYLNSLEYEGLSLSPADLGMDAAIMLNVDTTAILMSTGEENLEATWAVAGDELSIYLDGEVQTVFTLADGALVSDMDGGMMVFGREKPEAPVDSPVRGDAVLADFNGLWTASLVDIGGMKLSAEQMELDIRLAIANGQVAMLEFGEETQLQGDVVEGVLTAVGEEDGELVQMLFSLHEDGVLSTLFMDSILVYFQRAN